MWVIYHIDCDELLVVMWANVAHQVSPRLQGYASIHALTLVMVAKFI